MSVGARHRFGVVVAFLVAWVAVGSVLELPARAAGPRGAAGPRAQPQGTGSGARSPAPQLADSALREASPVEAMVATERAFSAMSVEQGMRDAFMTYLADDGILFRPLAINGKRLWEPRKRSPATLIWEPSHAEMSAAGDLGWTTGPWELRPGPDSTGAQPAPDQIGHGHFLSGWVRQADGSWKLAVDIGVSHAKPARGVGSGDLSVRPRHAWATGVRKPAKSRADLAAIDRLYARDAKKNGAGALAIWATEDVRFNREGAIPIDGREAAQSALKSAADLVRIIPQGSRVSESDDLGYSYGVLERMSSRRDAPDSSAYVHIWRKEADKKWRITALVENPIVRP